MPQARAHAPAAATARHRAREEHPPTVVGGSQPTVQRAAKDPPRGSRLGDAASTHSRSAIEGVARSFPPPPRPHWRRRQCGARPARPRADTVTVPRRRRGRARLPRRVCTRARGRAVPEPRPSRPSTTSVPPPPLSPLALCRARGGRPRRGARVRPRTSCPLPRCTTSIWGWEACGCVPHVAGAHAGPWGRVAGGGGCGGGSLSRARHRAAAARGRRGGARARARARARPAAATRAPPRGRRGAFDTDRAVAGGGVSAGGVVGMGWTRTQPCLRESALLGGGAAARGEFSR